MNDKLKHFLVTAGITIVTLILFAVIPHGPMNGYDKMIAIAVGVFAAAGKEIIWDRWLHRGTPDYYDFFAGVCGAYAGMFAWAIVETFIQIF